MKEEFFAVFRFVFYLGIAISVYYRFGFEEALLVLILEALEDIKLEIRG